MPTYIIELNDSDETGRIEVEAENVVMGKSGLIEFTAGSRHSERVHMMVPPQRVKAIYLEDAVTQVTQGDAKE